MVARAASIAMSALFTTTILAAILVLRSTSSRDRVAEYRTGRDLSGDLVNMDANLRTDRRTRWPGSD
jgi:hypothetical protein